MNHILKWGRGVDGRLNIHNSGNMVTAYNTQKIVSMDGTQLYSLDPEIYATMDEKAQTAALSSDEAVNSYEGLIESIHMME